MVNYIKFYIGWWAAWLNKNVNEIIAPKYWADIMLVMVTGQQEIHTQEDLLIWIGMGNYLTLKPTELMH
jgi:hypothetical protein